MLFLSVEFLLVLSLAVLSYRCAALTASPHDRAHEANPAPPHAAPELDLGKLFWIPEALGW